MNNKTKDADLEDFKYLIDSHIMSNKEKLAERDAILRAMN